jgi:hypothetical protein
LKKFDVFAKKIFIFSKISQKESCDFRKHFCQTENVRTIFAKIKLFIAKTKGRKILSNTLISHFRENYNKKQFCCNPTEVP